jgi:hypothetical protein
MNIKPLLLAGATGLVALFLLNKKVTAEEVLNQSATDALTAEIIAQLTAEDRAAVIEAAQNSGMTADQIATAVAAAVNAGYTLPDALAVVATAAAVVSASAAASAAVDAAQAETGYDPETNTENGEYVVPGAQAWVIDSNVAKTQAELEAEQAKLLKEQIEATGSSLTPAQQAAYDEAIANAEAAKSGEVLRSPVTGKLVETERAKYEHDAISYYQQARQNNPDVNTYYDYNTGILYEIRYEYKTVVFENGSTGVVGTPVSVPIMTPP